MMFLTSMLDAILAAATLSLRVSVVLFTQFHPIGHLYLTYIYSSFVVYVVAVIVRILLFRKTPSLSSRHRPVSHLLLGHVHPRQPIISTASVVLNILLLFATWDYIYRAHLLHQSADLSFSRVGYVDATSARISLRAPSRAGTSVELKLSLLSSPDEAITTQIGHASSDGDYMATFTLAHLESNTEYRYESNASHQGTFRTLENNPKTWSLVTTSCMKPFYPYRPWDHALRVRGLEHLDQYLAVEPVDMMLFLGDFIYIDLPLALGWTESHYTSAYRQVYASNSWTPRLRSLPWVHVYDDHEIINDATKEDTELFPIAMKPFQSYQGRNNPQSTFGQDGTHYVFHRGDVSFFILDTRRYRSDNTLEDGPEKTMLGSRQLMDLEHWLDTERRWKVVVSSVPFTRNWRGPDSADSWSGYIYERDRILSKMKQTDGVIILSGDRHEHATTVFPGGGDGKKDVIEFSTSPLNQFYEPFSRYHRQVEDTDISIYNHVKGNSKFGSITFNTLNDSKLDVTYKLIVDGSLVWMYNWTYDR